MVASAAIDAADVAASNGFMAGVEAAMLLGLWGVARSFFASTARFCSSDLSSASALDSSSDPTMSDVTTGTILVPRMTAVAQNHLSASPDGDDFFSRDGGKGHSTQEWFVLGGRDKNNGLS